MKSAPPRVTFWKGEKSRLVTLYQPCYCGCSPNWFLSGSNEDGEGFSIRLTEKEAKKLRKLDLF